MTLPFTIEDFLRVFLDYNAAIWPAQIIALVFGLVPLVAMFVRRDEATRYAFAALAVLWVFTGVGYHLLYFTRINPLAPFFAGFFVVQAIMLLTSSIWPSDPRLRLRRTPRSIAGFAIIVYALAVYPVLGIWMGHGWMAGPMFGVAPCPTTIFTLGILLIARGRWVLWISIIPVLWSIIGLAATVQLGILEDLGLPLAGAVLVGVLAKLLYLESLSRPKTQPGPHQP